MKMVRVLPVQAINFKGIESESGPVKQNRPLCIRSEAPVTPMFIEIHSRPPAQTTRPGTKVYRTEHR